MDSKNELGMCAFCGLQGPLQQIIQHIYTEHPEPTVEEYTAIEEHVVSPSVTFSDSNTSLPGPSTSSATLESFTWEDKYTKLLISTRLEMDNNFQNPKKKKNKLWEEVATAMKKICPLPITGNMCDTKWRNLMVTYKKILQKSKGTGQDATNWRFFDVMNEALGTRSNINPSPELIASSMVGLDEALPVVTQEDAVETQAPTGCANKTIKNIFKRKREEDRTAVLLLQQLSSLQKFQEERHEEKKRQWEERKRIEEERTQALEKITKAIERATSQK